MAGSVKIKDIMQSKIVSCQVHHTVEHVKKLMNKNKFSIVPIIGAEDTLKGVVSIKDILEHKNENSPISSIMISKVYVIPPYEDVQVAARMMRNHKIHHLIVTEDKRPIGVVSSYDLLKLVENHKFVAKNPSTQKKKVGKRKTVETL